jgi:hypothetical protein
MSVTVSNRLTLQIKHPAEISSGAPFVSIIDIRTRLGAGTARGGLSMCCETWSVGPEIEVDPAAPLSAGFDCFTLPAVRPSIPRPVVCTAGNTLNSPAIQAQR